MISVVATVLNEGESIQRLLDSLAEQTCQPDEIIITDGGSRDQTVTILQRYTTRLPLKILIEPGCNISAGRNRAIEAARGDIIAVTDAGVWLERDWLEKLMQPFLADSSTQVVGGFFKADPHNSFEAAMSATVLPLVDEIAPAAFLPSSRSVAFRKSGWAAVGGYPEWLDFCEDLIFDLRLKQAVGKFAFAPRAVVYFRPRGSLGAFYKQYYLYARGDGKADLWRKRHTIRYLTYLVAAPLIFLGGLFVHPLFWAFYLPGAIYYLYPPYRRLPTVLKSLPDRSFWGGVYAILLVPIIRVWGDIAKMIGYPVGLRWRRNNHPPDWRIIEL
jgi:glycosyltransferase involved in cell wall biosynthesis